MRWREKYSLLGFIHSSVKFDWFNYLNITAKLTVKCLKHWTLAATFHINWFYLTLTIDDDELWRTCIWRFGLIWDVQSLCEDVNTSLRFILFLILLYLPVWQLEGQFQVLCDCRHRLCKTCLQAVSVRTKILWQPSPNWSGEMLSRAWWLRIVSEHIAHTFDIKLWVLGESYLQYVRSCPGAAEPVWVAQSIFFQIPRLRIWRAKAQLHSW